MSAAAPPTMSTRDHHDGAGWAVIVPVKHATRGKSRLTSPGHDRVALARAFAIYTVTAAAGCDQVDVVIVVTDDQDVAARVDSFVRVVPEPREGGLNAAIAAGADAAGCGPRAVLLGDLPALRADDLRDALQQARAWERTVASDAEGTGSTLVTARAGVRWASSFGAGSFAAHLELGCVPLDLPVTSSLRRDVDTVEQLRAAAPLGYGSRTVSVLAGL